MKTDKFLTSFFVSHRRFNHSQPSKVLIRSRMVGVTSIVDALDLAQIFARVSTHRESVVTQKVFNPFKRYPLIPDADPEAMHNERKIISLLIRFSGGKKNEKKPLGTLLVELDRALRIRTFVNGDKMTLLDAIIWFKIWTGVPRSDISSNESPHLTRWFTFLSRNHCFSVTNFGATADTSRDVLAAPVDKETAYNTQQRRAFTTKLISHKSSWYLGLNVDISNHAGRIVTRFPPEPSGYLHIGHVKAAFLNYYLAKGLPGEYREHVGIFRVRIDDTNPTKEKNEYSEAILSDLTSLGLEADTITYSSDKFHVLEDYAEILILNGDAYVDDTDTDQMRLQRNQMKSGPCRTNTVNENLTNWSMMLNGDRNTSILRAKISMTHRNACMRDPCLYRVLGTMHHRMESGEIPQRRVYPTYDFACPVLDSVEGVTHALRTSEYSDRLEQYHWVQKSLGLRPVIVVEFSRVNMIHTVLSKRKLSWLIEEGYVSGWDDPRIPTIRGIIRRGLLPKSLKIFMTEQGGSKNVNLMEWDKLWNINKKEIDFNARRLTAVEDGMIRILVSNYDEISNTQKDVVNSTGETNDFPVHPHNHLLGTRRLVTGRYVYIDREDFVTLENGEEITLLHWGNCIVERKNESQVYTDTRNTGATFIFAPNGSFKTTKKKLHWLTCDSRGHIQLKLHRYENIITKRKIEETDSMKDIVNTNSHHCIDALGDLSFKELNEGCIIQIERKGYYIVDCIDAFIHLIGIPDGRTKTFTGATLSGV